MFPKNVNIMYAKIKIIVRMKSGWVCVRLQLWGSVS